MAGEPIRWAEIDAFAGGGGCGDVCGARRTLSANAHPLGGSRLRSPAATVARNRWTDSETPDALTDSVTESVVERAGPGWKPTGRVRRGGGGVQRSRSVEGPGMATDREFADNGGGGGAGNMQRHVMVRAASRDDSWEALEQQCRRMEAVGLRIDNIDLTCLDAEPAPHSPQSAQSAQSARSLALARLSAATAGAPANDPDGAPDVGETRRDWWRAPAGARKSEWGEAAEGQEAGEGTGEAHVKYAFSLVPTPRAKRDENSQWSDDSVQVQHPDGSDLPRPRAPSLDGGADVTEPEGSLDFAAIFANGTRDRVTLPGDAPSPSAPPVLVSAAVSAHKGGNAPPSPCAPVLLPGVIYCANRDCTTGSLGQGLPTPVQTVTNDISTTHFAATGQFSHGPPDSMHQSSFRSPHSSAHSSPYSSLSILPPSSSTVSYDHTLPSRSAIPTQASYSPTSSTFHSFASPACASPLGASPACTSPISATHAPSFPPTMPRPARQPARGVHRRSSSLSVLTENLPGVAPAAFNSPCSIRPAHTHLSASTVVSRPSAEKPPTPRKALVAPRFARSPHEPSAAAGSNSPRLQHMQQSQQVQMQQQQIEQVQQMQQMQHVQQYQQGPQSHQIHQMQHLQQQHMQQQHMQQQHMQQQHMQQQHMQQQHMQQHHMQQQHMQQQHMQQQQHQMQHVQHVQQYQQAPQVQQARPTRESIATGRPHTPSLHRFTPSLPELSVADAVEEEGGEGSEEGSDGSFSRSPVVAQLPWKDGKGRHGAPMQAQRLGVLGHSGRLGSPTQAGRIGSPMQAERLGSPTQAPRLGDTVQVRRFSPGGGGFPAGGSGRAGAEIKVWETSERGLLQGKGRSVSNRETGYRSMSSDNVLGEWSDIEADAEWVAVGGTQANAREAGGLDGGSPNCSGYRGMRGGAAAAHEDVRGGSVRGQEDCVKSTRSVLKKMLWRFKSGPGGQAEESAKGKTPPQQEQEEEEEAEEARQGEQEQERHGGHTVRVFAVAEC